jgi:uncharacterized protein DUF4167
MRPGQNKRMRGRPNNNRRGPNPLTRSYESNGPDVKIRGNAHHVAEKYLQLARDAHTSSDPVAAENYLQHAEHYFRLIAAAQAAQQQQQNGSRPPGENEDEMDDDDDFGGLNDRFASPAERAPAPSPYQPQPGFVPPGQGQPQPQPQPQGQPYQERAPYDNERQPQGDRGFQGRQDRPNRQPDRGPRDNRPYQERQDSQRDNRDNRFPRDNRPREFRPFRDPNQPREPVNQPEPVHAAALPSFITAPPRANPQPDVEETQFVAPVALADQPQPSIAEAPPAIDPAFAGEGEPRFPARGRRRRVRPSFGFDSPAEAQPAESGDAPPRKDEAPAGE